MYYIREVAGDDPLVGYDTHTVKAVVTAEDNGDGTLNTSVAYYDADTGRPVERGLFVNKLVSGGLRISKTLTGASGAAADMWFDFTLELADASGRALSGTYELTVDGYDGKPDKLLTDSVSLGEDGLAIAIEDGTARFRLADGMSLEIGGLPHGAFYRVTEDTVDNYVLVEANEAESSISAGAVAEAGFVNAYKSEGSIEIRAKKIMDGAGLTGGLFRFELVDRMSGSVKAEAVADSNGDIVFVVPFTEADISDVAREYYIREVGGSGGSGYAYDEHVSRVFIQVSVGDDGSLFAEVVNSDAVHEFTNAATFGLEFSKEVVGSAAVSAGISYAFELALTDGGYGFPDGMTYTRSTETGDVSGALELDADGRFAFELLAGETVRFDGLPQDTEYSITEAEGAYMTKVSTGGRETESRTASGTIDGSDASLVYVNTYGLDMPMTGGTGTAWLYAAGGCLVLIGLAMALAYDRKRRGA